MGNVRVRWGEPIPKGKYRCSKKLTTIEDPREAEYDEKEIMTGKEWETHTIYPGKPFEITGSFQHRNKTWYQVKNRKAKRPQVINHIVMLNALLTQVQ